MFVHQILRGKPEGREGVIWLKRDQMLEEAVDTLASQKIGTVLISDDGKAPIGILSERDVVRVLGQRGPSCLKDKVETVMTPDPKCCSLNDQSDDVLGKMTRGRFRHMPVVENGEMVGLISIKDVVEARVATLAMEKQALEGMIMGF